MRYSRRSDSDWPRPSAVVRTMEPNDSNSPVADVADQIGNAREHLEDGLHPYRFFPGNDVRRHTNEGNGLKFMVALFQANKAFYLKFNFQRLLRLANDLTSSGQATTNFVIAS